MHLELLRALAAAVGLLRARRPARGDQAAAHLGQVDERLRAGLVFAAWCIGDS